MLKKAMLGLSIILSAQLSLIAALAQSIPTHTQVAVWKTITIGAHRSAIDLREALQAKECGTIDPKVPRRPTRIPCLLGDDANEIIGQGEFELTRASAQIELVL